MTLSDSRSEARTSRLEHFPVPFFAAVMGLSGLTTALHLAGLPLAGLVALAGTVAVFVTLVSIYSLKALRYPGAVAAEWKHPVKLAFFPAFSISMLLIATALAPTSQGLARVIWLIGAASQATLSLAVLSNWIGHRKFQTIHISPAWFIPAVGNVVAPVAGVGLGFPETSWVFFSAGLIFWIVLLVLVMNRLIFHDPLPGRMVPTLAILIAPPAVTFLAWLQLNGGVLDAFARILYGATLVFLGLALTQVGKLRGQPFSLSLWALSFPVAALTLASLRFGTLAASPGHTLAGQVGLTALCLIIAGLLFGTGRAIARGEICVPE
ncbi:SLAC1 anion channel family protein [Pseudooceanicola algae]|uniref:Tellurite resistance protein TehA n=1 Tax=Pseudooceanicola algae TaxID=1537215 RepID=A0A418SK52_9RHOB|nr:SLAC1 anion channel family protein [Pseudooceanicola algae]QPM92193.1 Tellurite resistance protein TehA [Pseudooceanicola algae]